MTQAEVDTPLLLEANVHPGSVDSGLIAFPVYGPTIDRSVISGQGPLGGILHPSVAGLAPKFDPLRGYSRLMARLKALLLTSNNYLPASGKGRSFVAGKGPCFARVRSN